MQRVKILNFGTIELWNFALMDEYSRGMDPEVKIYFRKIMKSFAAALLWFIVVSTLAFSFKMAHIKSSISWQNIVFFLLFFITLLLLCYFLFRIWKKDFTKEKLL